jgi:hypothetical protein
MDVVQLIYRPMEPLGVFKDFEFSRSTMAARWKQGLSDVLSLCRPPCGSHRCRRCGCSMLHDLLTLQARLLAPPLSATIGDSSVRQRAFNLLAQTTATVAREVSQEAPQCSARRRPLGVAAIACGDRCEQICPCPGAQSRPNGSSRSDRHIGLSHD